MKLIRIAGHVVNMDQILYVEYGSDEGNEFVMFNFVASVQRTSEGTMGNTPSWRVQGNEATAFIRWLENNSDDVMHPPSRRPISV